MTGTGTLNSNHGHWAQRLLDSEQQSLVKLLHDDLGQNLVAIRSFAAAICERHENTDGDTGELAQMIRDAADSAYRSSYDLMQELRVQSLADREIAEALNTCLDEARLKQNGIAYESRVDPSLNCLDTATKALILRNTRCFANFCKSLEGCENFSVDLRPGAGEVKSALEMTLVRCGRFEYLNREDLALVSLAERLAAIGGETSLETSEDNDRITLELRFDRLRVDGEASP